MARRRLTLANTHRLRIELHRAHSEIAALRQECVAYSLEVDRLRIETYTDPLTGAYNRTGLRHIWAEVARDLTAVFVLDCDHFKRINDRYGHGAGDIVICHIAEIIRAHGIIVARTMGDEFIGLITQSEQSPEVLVDQLRLAIAKPRSINGNTIEATATIGICLVDQGSNGPTSSQVDYLDQADTALYQGKRAGRNTIVTTKIE